MSAAAPDWNPEAYARFRDLRLRPALDLLAQVPELPAGDIIDLGCGNGAVGPALRDRFPRHRLIGVDRSAVMLDTARAGGAYSGLVHQDAAAWRPEAPPALIFSNALCHWLPDHDRLFPVLVGLLAPKGTLAVQMPRQQLAPSHALLRSVASELFPDMFDFADWHPEVAEPEFYHELLERVGGLTLWETEYFQQLAAPDSGHPVRHFTQSTAMRPIVERLTKDQADLFITAYDRALELAYPPRASGGVVFPFRRLFFILTRR